MLFFQLYNVSYYSGDVWIIITFVTHFSFFLSLFRLGKVFIRNGKTDGVLGFTWKKDVCAKGEEEERERGAAASEEVPATRSYFMSLKC